MQKEKVELPNGVMIISETDAKGRIVFANDDFCKIAGYSINELVGKPHNIVRHNEMPKDAFQDLWTTLKSGNVWKGIVKNKVKNGGYYWVNATVFPSKTPDGKIRYISIRVKPTEQEIEDAEKTYSALL